MSRLQTKQELLQVAKQILMNAEMAKAIMDGRKVHTRRVIALPFKPDSINIINAKNGVIFDIEFENFDTEEFEIIKQKYKIGDILWVREPVKIVSFDNVRISDAFEFEVEYVSDGNTKVLKIPERISESRWLKRGRGVPNGCIKEMARTLLKVTNVRVEILQDISYDDIQREGYSEVAMNSIAGFNWWINLWNSTASKGYKWEDNPHVFVYEFERV